MKYYSKITFFIIIIINTLATLIALLDLLWVISWYGLLGAGSWSALMFNGEGFSYNFFIYIIPLPFFIFSTSIILLQQKGYKHLGYFMIILTLISSYCFIYMQTAWSFWSNIGEVISTTPPLILFFKFILLLAAIIPFYVLIKLVKADFFKK